MRALPGLDQDVLARGGAALELVGMASGVEPWRVCSVGCVGGILTAASEARRIALMLNDSKWQEIETSIREALESTRAEGCTAGWLAHSKTVEHLYRNNGHMLGGGSGGGIHPDQWRERDYTPEHFCRRGGIAKGSDDGCCAGLPDPQFAWRDQPDGVR